MTAQICKQSENVSTYFFSQNAEQDEQQWQHNLMPDALSKYIV